MAAVARPPVGGGSGGMKAALIAFVCLTVASLGAFIFLFTQQSDLQSEIDAARTQARQSEDRARQAGEVLRAIAMQSVGLTSDDPAAIQEALKSVRAPLLQDKALHDMQPGDALSAALQKLYGQYRDLTAQLAQKTAERDELATKLDAAVKSAQAAEKNFQDRINELQGQYTKLEQDFTTAREAWNSDTASLNQRLTAAGDTAGQTLNKVRATVADLQKQVADRDARIQELRETLASFRPSADQFAAIQIADGSVVRTVPGQGLAYISLGSSDKVRPGMNFSVYSRHRGVPADGKGKATLEVTQVFETTAECKVTSTTPGEPIVQGDVVANPVYDRHRQFSFVVAGDFDLDYDGSVDDPAGQEVARLIQAWGGKVVKTVDTRTDFVVLGAAPALIVRGPTPDEAVVAEHTQETNTARDQFNAVTTEAKALGIPILTRTQFLHFIGRPVPQGAKGP